MEKHNYNNEFKNLFQEVKSNLDDATIAVLENLQNLSSHEIYEYLENLFRLLLEKYKLTLRQVSKKLNKTEEEISDSPFLDDYGCALEKMGASIRKYPEDDECDFDSAWEEFLDNLAFAITDLVNELKITPQALNFLLELHDIKLYANYD